MSKVVVYGDVSLDAVDGSSIWLVSICEVLSEIFDEVHLQLKLNPKSERLVGKLRSLSNVFVYQNQSQSTGGKSRQHPLTPEEASQIVGKLVSEIGADAVIARGFDVCHYFSRNRNIAPVLCSYITDLPYPVTSLSKNNMGRLKGIALRSRLMFSQTESSRSYLESIVSQAAGKTVLLPPMIPDYAFMSPSSDNGRANDPLQLVYSGKLAKDWRTLEILDLPQHLRDLGVKAHLTIIGDKYLRTPRDPGWLTQMREGMEEVAAGRKYNVQWLGGLDRESAIREMAKADIGIGWRSTELDSSLEISTKALEYSAAGLPTIVNASVDHIALFGHDYPFFVGGESSVADIARAIAENHHEIDRQREHVVSLAKGFSFASARERLREVFHRKGVLRNPARTKARVINLGVVSHDFKFMGEVMDHFHRDPQLNVKVDGWESLHKHDIQLSKDITAWADVILCEWAGPAAAWYSNNKRPGTRLYVRLHAFELRGAWMKNVKWEAVDKVVFVSELYRQKAITKLGLSAAKTTVIPNAIDVADFRRPKMDGSSFNIGLVGMVGFGKRPDRALDCLEELLSIDSRYRLFIKSRPPWEYPYEWDRPVQRQLYLEFFNRIRKSELLKRSVVFDDFSPDIASWFRKIGFVLSPSAFESFHLAPAEGMSSGSVPIFWEREGVKEIFDGMEIVSTSRQAAQFIASTNEKRGRDKLAKVSQQYAEKWDFPVLQEQWDELILSDISGDQDV